MGIQDSLSRDLEKEESGMDAYVFDKGQLQDLENDDLREEEDREDVALEGIDVAI